MLKWQRKNLNPDLTTNYMSQNMQIELTTCYNLCCIKLSFYATEKCWTKPQIKIILLKLNNDLTKISMFYQQSHDIFLSKR